MKAATLASLLAMITCLASTAQGQNPGQWINLGGGCAGATNPVGFILSGSGGNPTQTGCVRLTYFYSVDLTSDHLDLMIVGFSDPNLLLPSCGCVLHASMDLLLFSHVPPNSTNWYCLTYPQALYGQSLYFQVAELPITAQTTPFPYWTFGPPWTNGCTEEPSLAPRLSQAHRVILN
jgi:hypothetical protein